MIGGAVKRIILREENECKNDTGDVALCTKPMQVKKWVMET